MFLRATSKIVMLSAMCLASAAYAEEPTAGTEVVVDRDGKPICGYQMMSESERGGYRSLMHGAKKIEDRDAIRAEHCKAMAKRAQDRAAADGKK